MWATAVWLAMAEVVAPLPAPPEVCVLREGWTAPVAPEQVRDALALRLPDQRVLVCEVPRAGACRVWLAALAPRTLTVSVACGAAAGTRDHVLVSEPRDTARRIAVEAAALLV